MQIVTGRRGEPHVTSRQMQAVYRSFLGDFALLDIGEKLRAEAYSDDIVRVYDGVVSVQGIYAVIAYNQYDEVYIEPVSVGKKRIDTIVLHYTKNNTLDVEDMQLDVVQGEEYTDNPVPPTISEGGDAWEGTTDIQVPIYDVEVTNFGLTVTPYARMLNLIPTLESIAERIPETVVTGVKGDSEVLYRDGDVNITKANIGLGNVDNTADTDKPISTATQTALNLKADLTYVDAKISAAYHAGGSKTVAELTSALLIADNIGKVYNMSDSGVTTSDFVEGAGKSINEGDNVGICNVGTEESPVYKFDLLSGFVDLSAYATTSAVNTALAGKVDKVAGKGLSTEDYTTIDKTKLAGISEGATQTIANPADTATETLSKLEVGGVVYDVPQGTTGATNLSELNDVNLSGTVEGDILEYDSTANKWKNSNALQGAKTATGNPITVSDAAPVNAVNLNVDLEPVQEGSGTPSPDNIRPISGRSEVAIQRVGVNLFGGIDFAEALHAKSDYGTIDTTNKTVSFNRTSNYSPIFEYPFKENTQYTFIYSGNTESANQKNTSILFEYTDGTESAAVNLSSNTKGTYAIQSTSGKTIKNIDLRWANGANAVLYYDECGLFEGALTTSDFEPYAGKTYTIQIGQTVYGGQLDVTKGKMVVTHKGVVYDGSSDEDWDGSAQVHGISIDSIYSIDQVPMANCFKGVSPRIHSSLKIGELALNPSLMAINVYYSISGLDNWKSYLASNPLQVVYELATPFTIDLTPQQIKLLENTNTITTDYDGDVLSLEYQPNNAIGEAVRVVEESYDPEFAVRPPLKKIAFSGTTDSDGSVTLINASDIPSGHKIIPLQITDMTIDGSAGTYFVEYEPYNSGDAVKGYCYFYMSGSQMFPVGKAITGNFYYYELEG